MSDCKTLDRKWREKLLEVLPPDSHTLLFLCSAEYNDSYYQPSPNSVWVLAKNKEMLLELTFSKFDSLLYNAMPYREYSKLIWEFDFDDFDSETEFITVKLKDKTDD